MNDFLYALIGIIVPFSTVIPLLVAGLKYRLLDKSIWLVVAFLAVSLLINTSASILSSYGKNNLPLLHLYTLTEGVLLLLFFNQCIGSERGRKLCKAFLLIFPLLCIIDVLFFHSIYQFNSYSRPIESIFLVIMAMTYITEQIGRERKTGIERARFWIVLGILLYFSASFFHFLFSNLVSATLEKHIKLIIWSLHASFVLVIYALITVGLTKLKYDR